MSSIRPNPEQFRQLGQSAEKGPVVMLNLLKFKGVAKGEPAPAKMPTLATATPPSRCSRSVEDVSSGKDARIRPS